MGSLDVRLGDWGGGEVAWIGRGVRNSKPGGGCVKGLKLISTFGFECRVSICLASILRLTSDACNACSKELLGGLSIDRDPYLGGFLGEALVRYGYEP